MKRWEEDSVYPPQYIEGWNAAMREATKFMIVSWVCLSAMCITAGILIGVWVT